MLNFINFIWRWVLVHLRWLVCRGGTHQKPHWRRRVNSTRRLAVPTIELQHRQVIQITKYKTFYSLFYYFSGPGAGKPCAIPFKASTMTYFGCLTMGYEVTKKLFKNKVNLKPIIALVLYRGRWSWLLCTRDLGVLWARLSRTSKCLHHWRDYESDSSQRWSKWFNDSTEAVRDHVMFPPSHCSDG